MALACALLIWAITLLAGQGRAAGSAEKGLPRNTVDMHGTYAGVAHALPWFRG